ncbi:uncharacterized protein N0V89_006527 [Didymosphaeria variabile]|uniref:Uncharacterized protein n=1 Tax=Didymosphaeria variabile TaxID=1932322 RepID=A0A9W9C9D4_9PLEO|nr:uncharacterized protein N0V89_006527 [Didymosphaeria variabile]KAJ4351188.1 hypothetical protein N0V89_006527 [Didymosphaeria variabile]
MSTVQPWAGHADSARRRAEARAAEPVPTVNFNNAARAAIGHFPLSVAEAAETILPAKRHAKAFGHFPLDVASAEPTGLSKRLNVCGTNDKYVSACSCAGVPQATVTAVRKTVSSTSTSTATSSFQTTSTVTNSHTISESVTATETSTTTTTLTSTSTYSTSVMASPTCATFSKGPTANWQYTYNLEYAGFKTLNDNSPANNAGAPAISQVLDGTLGACDAAEDCVAWAATQFSPLGGGYFTTNLRFRPDSTNWLCVAYYDQTPASYYNVDSPGVSQSFGWTKRP